MAFKVLSENINLTGQKGQEYIESTAEYYKLRLFKSSMTFATSLINLLVIGSMAMLVLAFVSFGVALLISRLIEYPSSGFFIVGAFYLVLLIIIATFGKKYIVKFVLEKFSALIVEEDDNDPSSVIPNTADKSLEEAL